MQTLTINVDLECDMCLTKKIHKPATTKAAHPDFHGWELCGECAEELNKQKPFYQLGDPDPSERKPL